MRLRRNGVRLAAWSGSAMARSASDSRSARGGRSVQGAARSWLGRVGPRRFGARRGGRRSVQGAARLGACCCGAVGAEHRVGFLAVLGRRRCHGSRARVAWPTSWCACGTEVLVAGRVCEREAREERE
jgi:hypothetical protein